MLSVPVVQEHPVPDGVLSLTDLPVEYADLFVASVPDATQVSAEKWARAAMEGSPDVGRFIAWRLLCNLRLGPASNGDHIAGWKVVDRGDNWIRTRAASWFMTANIIFKAEDDRVLFATLIHYEHPVGKVLWGATVSRIHRAIAPEFLRAGVVRVLRGSRR